MSLRSVAWRRLAGGMIPVAFLAALPLVQWCSLGSDPADVRCLLTGDASAATPVHPEPACASGCVARGVTEGQCPLEPSSHRAFCIGAASGGPGVRPLAPVLVAPFAALPVEQPAVEDATLKSGCVAWDRAERPPSPAHVRRPPARAPPAS
jgi:hypothetical protein